MNRDGSVTVRLEVLERANTHQAVVFTEVKTRPYTRRNRSLLNMCVCQKLPDDVWIFAIVPLSHHARIGPQDEQHCVRAEGMRCCRLTAAPEGSETLVEYTCWLDLKMQLPTWAANRLGLPPMMRLPAQLKSYFGRILDKEHQEAVDENNMELRRLYCVILLGFAEDLPMSLLSTYYLVKSMDECIGSAIAHKVPSTELVVCDTRPGSQNHLNVISVVTSAAMLMYKVRASRIRLRGCSLRADASERKR